MKLKKTTRKVVLLGVVGCLLLALSTAIGISSASTSTLYVRPDGSGECSDWGNACTLQTALGDADTGDEIWVMTGVYTPTTTRTDRNATFQLKNAVGVYGGFAGTEASREQRDWDANVTVLSGDIDDNDITDPNGVITTTINITGTNSYHVVTGSGTDVTAILDGFTVTGGNADGSDPDNRGGGMYNDGGSPTLNHVTFSGNSAAVAGGVYNVGNSSPTLANVAFTGNSAVHGGGMFSASGSTPLLNNGTFSGNSADYGGGMYNWESSPTLTDVTFSTNSAEWNGGGMLNWVSSPGLVNVTFSGNSAGWGGGGMFNYYESSPTLTNVAFSGNSASEEGGGMNNSDTSNPALTNVSFSGNWADSFGGGVYNDENSSPTLTNSILWGNTAITGTQIHNDNSTATISYSLVEGGRPAGATCDGHTIYEDPQFVDPDGPDATPGTQDDDLRLQDTSPAIDKGSNGALPADTVDLDGDGNTTEKLPFDVDGNPRIVCIVDMEAYEAKETTVCTEKGYLPLVMKAYAP